MIFHLQLHFKYDFANFRHCFIFYFIRFHSCLIIRVQLPALRLFRPICIFLEFAIFIIYILTIVRRILY